MSPANRRDRAAPLDPPVPPWFRIGGVALLLALQAGALLLVDLGLSLWPLLLALAAGNAATLWLATRPPRTAGLTRLALRLVAGGLVTDVVLGATVWAWPPGVAHLDGLALLLACLGARGAALPLLGLLYRQLDLQSHLSIGLQRLLPTLFLMLCAGGGALMGSLYTARSVRQAEARALTEARLLAGIGRAYLESEHRSPADLSALRPLVPSPGIIEVSDGVTSGVLRSSTAVRCHVVGAVGPLGLPLPARPCARVGLADGRELRVALPPRLRIETIPLFALVALVLAAGLGLGAGLLLSTPVSRELARMEQELGRLHAEAQALTLRLDRAWIPTTVDELGDLTESLEAVRQRLAPHVEQGRHARDRARTADRERDALMTRISEALMEPIETLRRSAEGLLAGRVGPLAVGQEEDVRLILSATQHLSELISEVLDLSSAASGEIVLSRGELDLRSLVQDAAASQRPLLQKKRIQLKIDLPTSPLVAHVDGKRIRQILNNLLSNAVKFTGQGQITVSAQQRAEQFVLTVSDTGAGIARDKLASVFQEFVQLGPGRQRAQGTGLGLAICKRLAEAHGGTIEVDSNEGQGSTFRLLLPMGHSASVPQPAAIVLTASEGR